MDFNLWMGIIPVLVFVILESFTNKKIALISAMVLAIAELVFTIIVYHTIDEITILGFVLVGIAIFLSLKTENDIYFKLQPAIFGWILCMVFFFFYYALNRPLLNEMFQKYMSSSIRELMGNNIDPNFLERYLKILSKDLGWLFFIHGSLVAFSAYKMNKWWWFVFRVPGFYILLFIFSIIAMKKAII